MNFFSAHKRPAIAILRFDMYLHLNLNEIFIANNCKCNRVCGPDQIIDVDWLFFILVKVGFEILSFCSRRIQA